MLPLRICLVFVTVIRFSVVVRAQGQTAGGSSNFAASLLTGLFDSITTTADSKGCPGTCVHAIASLMCEDIVEDAPCPYASLRCCVSKPLRPPPPHHSYPHHTNHPHHSHHPHHTEEDIQDTGSQSGSESDETESSTLLNQHSNEDDEAEDEYQPLSYVMSSTTATSPTTKVTVSVTNKHITYQPPLSVSATTESHKVPNIQTEEDEVDNSTEDPNTSQQQTSQPEESSQSSSSQMRCPGVCVATKIAKFCEVVVEGYQGLCPQNLHCCVKESGGDSEEQQSGDTEMSTVYSSINQSTEVDNKVELTNSDESQTPISPIFILEEFRCQGTCLSAFFSFFCDDVDTDAICPHRGRCCINKRVTTSSPLNSSYPFRQPPRPLPPPLPCPGVCVAVQRPDLCPAPSIILPRTSTCLHGTLCCSKHHLIPRPDFGNGSIYHHAYPPMLPRPGGVFRPLPLPPPPSHLPIPGHIVRPTTTEATSTTFSTTAATQNGDGLENKLQSFADERPACPGSCIFNYLSFTCFRNAEMTNLFKCAKHGTSCCAPKAAIRDLEVQNGLPKNDTDIIEGGSQALGAILNGGMGSPNSISSVNTRPLSNNRYICGVKGSIRNGRVVGGENSEAGEWCWQAALINSLNQYLCGGALIGTQWVLTAAHCVTNTVRSGDAIYVRVGDHDLTSKYGSPGAQTLRVATTYIHHNHNSQTLDNDIALLKLHGQVELKDGVCLVCLPARGVNQVAGKRCTVTGYGYMGETGPIPLRVREAEVPIVSDAECIRKINAVTEKIFILPASSFCAGGDEGHDACQGDGGGPMVCQDDGYHELTGLVSWGFGCGRVDVPGVYVKVSSFIGWINQIISVNNL